MAKDYCILSNRGIIEISGDDRVAFLQGIITNDAEKLSPDQSLYAAFLTPQGKYLHDFFLVAAQDKILIDIEKSRLADLMKRLSIYKLRAKVALRDASDEYTVTALLDLDAAILFGIVAAAGRTKTANGAHIMVDPRFPGMGLRAVVQRQKWAETEKTWASQGFKPCDYALYDYQRSALGLPDGLQDLQQDRAILLENGFDELHAIDWQKGCYMGQELTARTRYRGLVRKRLMPVLIEGAPPAIGTALMANGKEAGEMRSHAVLPGRPAIGLAMVRLEAFANLTPLSGLEANGAQLRPYLPEWFVMPESDKGNVAV